MRPHAHSADHQSCHFSLITCRYLRYVLIRSLAYTNDRTVAERIAVYTLITTCLLGDRLWRKSDLGLVVDTMIEMIGSDQVSSRKFEGGEDQCADFKLQTSNFTLADNNPEVFFLSAPMCEVAGAINGLDGFERQLLVLHHIEGMAVPALAEVYVTAPGRIEKALAKAERQFVEILRGMSSWNHEIEPDVHSLLTDFAGCIDAGWSKVIADSALDYLGTHRW